MADSIEYLVTEGSPNKLRDPLLEASRSWLAFALLCAARFMVMLDLSVVVLALPALQSSFKALASTTQWVLSIYALSFGGLLLLAGRAGDLFGRRRILILGFGTFSLASLLGGLAPTMMWFIAARALQGIGAAMISPTAFATVTTLFGDARRRNRSISIWSALSGVAFPVGTLLGGLLVAGPGWRWVMFINVPIGLMSCFLAPILIRSDNEGKQGGKLDLLGSATVTIGLTALVWVVSEGNVTGWLSMPTVLVGALSVALLVAFVAIEKRTSEPVLRFDIFRDRSLLGANLTLLLVYAGLVACVFTLSFFLQRNLSLSSVRSGFAFIPTSVVLIVATSFSSRLASRMGMRFLVAYASIAMAAGFFLYSRMGSTDQFIIPFLAGSVLIGLFGLALPILFTVGVAGVPLAHRGAASGLLNTSQQVGAALGVAIATVVESAANNPVARGEGAHGAVASVGPQHGFVACAIFLVIGAGVAMSLIRRESRLTKAVS